MALNDDEGRYTTTTVSPCRFSSTTDHGMKSTNLSVLVPTEPPLWYFRAGTVTKMWSSTWWNDATLTLSNLVGRILLMMDANS